MPKGKKKGKGKGKGKGEKKGGGLPPPPKVEEETVNELSKQFYLIQIKDLEDRLARYQAKSDRLQLSNDDLQRKLSQQLEDQEEMILFLKKKSQKQAEQYVDIEERQIALQQAKDQEQERSEQQLAQLKEDSQRALDQAAVENRVLQGQLESLEDFRLNKEKLEGEMRTMEELLEQQKREHGEKLYKLEKKAVLDKDRMKKDMIGKVNSVASEFRKVSDLQMAETTKRTIRENVSISTQLSKMSDKTVDLIRENEALRGRERALRRQVEILEANERELTKRNVSSQKVLVMLKDRALEQQQQLMVLQERAVRSDQLEQEAMEGEERVEASHRDTELLREQVASLEDELSTLKQQLAESTRELLKLRTAITRASLAIQASLQPTSSDSEHLVTRENLLATLLQLLNLASSSSSSSLPLNLETTPHHQISSGPTLQYKPGDLGIVPAARGQNALRLSLQSQAGTGHPRQESKNSVMGTQLPPLVTATGGLVLTGGRIR